MSLPWPVAIGMNQKFTNPAAAAHPIPNMAT